MDCARTAKRLTGGEVMIVYRRTIEQMPAEREEREGAREEGIAFLELLAPRRLLIRDGKVAGLCCARMELGEPDASGRPRPVEIRGSETDLALDTLLVAVGQRADLAFCEAEGIRLNSRGYIAVDPETLETTVPGVYAGGDAAADGPRTIVAAAGDGRKIAADILRRESIATTERRKPTTVLPSLADLLARRAKRLWRVPIPHRPPPARAGFDEVIETLGAETAREEAARCLDCDVLCSTCAGVCPNRAIFTYECEPFEAELPDEDGSPQVRPPVKNTEYLRDHALESEAVPSRGGVTPGSPVGLRRRFAVAQRFQVAVLTDFCNECGNCQTFCPTRGAPYRDKPRLYLTRAEFEAQSGNAFMILRDGNAWSILARCGGDTHSLLTRDGDLLYRSPWGQTVLRADTLAPVSGASPVSLLPVAQMFVLLRALRRFVPHLPTASV
jgi:putative selenate reductase